MNSTLKELERNCAPIDFIEPLARLVLDDLAMWANDNIYSKKSGCLTYELPLDGNINAACTSYHDSRYRTHIEINLGMVQEIYIQSFTYPGYIKNLESGNWHFNALDEPFSDAEFLFEGGIPQESARLTRSLIWSSYTKIFLTTEIRCGLMKN